MRTAPTALESSQIPRLRSWPSAGCHRLSVLLVAIWAAPRRPELRSRSRAPIPTPPVGMNFVVAGYNLQWGSLLVDPALPVDNASATINGVSARCSAHLYRSPSQSASTIPPRSSTSQRTAGDFAQASAFHIRRVTGLSRAASVAVFTANNEFIGTHRFEQRPMSVFEASAIRYFTPRV